MAGGGGGVIDVIVYPKLYARSLAVKLEEMYLIFSFLYDRSSYLCLCGGFGPLYINYLQTVLWSVAISSWGQFYGLESSSWYW